MSNPRRAATYGRFAQALDPAAAREAQLAPARAYAAAKGCVVVEEIFDEFASGLKHDRPGLMKLRRLVAAKLLDSVIVTEVDRLSRDLRTLHQLEIEFTSANVELHAAASGGILLPRALHRRRRAPHALSDTAS